MPRVSKKTLRAVQQFEYDKLRDHIGHKIACVCYGKDGQDPYNVSVECEDCSIVLTDVNHPDVDA